MLGDRGGVSRGGSLRRRMGCGKRAAAIHALLLLRLWSRAAYVETTKQAQRAAKKHGFAIGQSSDILLHPPLPSVAVPIAMERGRRRKKNSAAERSGPVASLGVGVCAGQQYLRHLLDRRRPLTLLSLRAQAAGGNDLKDTPYLLHGQWNPR